MNILIAFPKLLSNFTEKNCFTFFHLILNAKFFS